MLEATITTFLQQHELLNRRLIVAVSGGMDSMVLLHGLREIGHGGIVVVHVDHGLREESTDDAHFVQQICADWNIPCHIKTLDLTTNSEQAARRARYRVLSLVATEQSCTAILTAHHADDQVETVLMNLLRGTGVDGLGGMAAISDVPHGVDNEQQLYRPILSLPRSTIQTYREQNTIPFVEDTTNNDTRYTRNRVRYHLLPALEEHAPYIRKRLLQLVEMSSADANLLHTLTQQTFARLQVSSGNNWLELDLVQWRALPLSLRRRTLRWALQTLDDATEVSFAAIEEARAVAEQGQVRNEAALPNDWRLRVGYDRLLIAARDFVPTLDVPQVAESVVLMVPGHVGLGTGWEVSAEIVPTPTSIRLSSSPTTVYIPYFETLLIRGRRSGERMHPFGASGSAKLKRIMIDRKIPQRARAAWPLVVVDDQIVWVVGEILGEAGRVSDDVKRCIKLTLTRKSDNQFV